MCSEPGSPWAGLWKECAVEKILWLVLGATVVAASLVAHRNDRARWAARIALGVLFLVFGALVNAVYLATDPDSFASFAEMSQFEFVRRTWASVVAPDLGIFIGLLIAGEAVMGLLVLSGGRPLQVGLVLMAGFHVGVLFFGWWMWLYALPMLAAIMLLLRAERTRGVDRASALETHRAARMQAGVLRGGR